MENQRQTNIEICRLVSIILVMLVHTTFVTFGWETESIGLQLLAGFSIIGVNVFVLITGYFSANLKKTSLISLAFFCLFWAIIKINIHLYFGQCVSLRDFFFITSSNWFIPCYIGLLLLSPLLNTFCKYAGKNNLRLVVISLLLLEIWFDWIPPYPVLKIGTMGGCSVLSFTILYLLARYISVYDIPKWFKKFSFFIYVGCSILLVILHNVLLQLDLSMPKLMFYYNNPVIIVSSVAFLTIFLKIDIQSTFINHIAKSTLACLLGHSAIFFLYTKQFRYLYNNFSGFQLVAYWILAIFLVFCASIAIDQLRLLLYMSIENHMKKKIKNNIILELPTGK